MFKLIGAIVVGLLTMGAALYLIARPKEQRSTDMSTAKNMLSSAAKSVKTYWNDLMNPQPSTPEVA